jgi:hypothetical protein
MRQWLGMISHFEGETPCHTQTVSQNLALAIKVIRGIGIEALRYVYSNMRIIAIPLYVVKKIMTATPP